MPVVTWLASIKSNAKTVDSWLILFFALFSTYYFIVRINGDNKHLFPPGSDSANIASMAAAIDQPEIFQGDELLGNPGNFRFYSNLQIYLVSFLRRFTADYGLALNSLLWIHTFLQLFGFYLLGLVIFKKRLWAFLLTIVAVMYVPLALGDFWGMFYEPLPRTAFQAAIPLFLAAVFTWPEKPATWPCLFAGMGLLMFLHPLSTSVWIFAIVFALLFSSSRIEMKKKLYWLLVSGIIFLLLASPFVARYFSGREHSSGENYFQIYHILTYRFIKGYFDIPLSFNKFLVKNNTFFVNLLGIFSYLYLLFCRKQQSREEETRIRILGILILSIVVFSVGVPYIEQIIDKKKQMIPSQASQIRNLRFFYPLMLLSFLWALVAFERQVRGERWKKAAVAAGVLFCSFVVIRQSVRFNVYLERNGYFLGRNDPYNSATVEVLRAVKRITPERARIFALSDYELGVRYFSLRPLVYSAKDGGALGYSNHKELIEWFEKTKKVNGFLNSLGKMAGSEKEREVRKLGREFGAEYLLLERRYFSGMETLQGIIYRNDYYLLIGLKKG